MRYFLCCLSHVPWEENTVEVHSKLQREGADVSQHHLQICHVKHLGHSQNDDNDDEKE